MSARLEFEVTGQRTVAWDTGESDIQPDCESLTPAFIDDNGGVHADSPVVEKLYGCEGKDDGGGNEGHWREISLTRFVVYLRRHTKCPSPGLDLYIFRRL